MGVEWRRTAKFPGLVEPSGLVVGSVVFSARSRIISRAIAPKRRSQAGRRTRWQPLASITRNGAPLRVDAHAGVGQRNSSDLKPGPLANATIRPPLGHARMLRRRARISAAARLATPTIVCLDSCGAERSVNEAVRMVAKYIDLA